MWSPGILAWVVLLGGSATLLAQTPVPPPSDPPADVVSRLAQLEVETQSLRAEVQSLREGLVRLPAVGATPVAMAAPAVPPADPTLAVPAATENRPLGARPPEPQPSMDEIRGEMRKLAWTKGDFTIVPYGYLWGNTVYSTERTSPGSYTLYVLSASTLPENESIVDVRNTRLGFDVAGPKIPWLGDAMSGGKVEIDFQNSVLTTENKPTVLLRHAYAEVKDDEFRLLVGQTWDVISPLYPGMLMYSVGWDGGNIGYRRAQVRGERYFALSDVSLVTAQLSINQNVFPDGTTLIKGESSNWPIVEGRVAWTVGHRGPDCLPITVGLSGHIGEEEFDYGTTQFNDSRRTWSGNVDLRVPITPRLGFQAECQVGENLSAFLGGIGQGIDPTTLNTIRDAGGWFEIWYDWTPTLHSHVGYSVDDPNDHDLVTTGERKYNQFYFGNLIFDVTKNFLIGVEVSSWKTLYVNQLPGDSLRCEFVAKYGF
jgi:hypothetical protein